MRFGTPASETNDNSGDYLRNLKSGDTKVRFLHEIPTWVGYYEHFIGKQAFPCTGDRMTCPGCTHEDTSVQKATRRWAANVLLVDQGSVVPMKLANTIKKKCENRAARNDGSITTRDYTLIKEGQSLETTYDVDQDEKYRINLEDYEESMQDLHEILKSMFEEVWGDADDYAPENQAPAEKPKRKRETVDDQIERWEEEKAAAKTPAKKAAAKPPAKKAAAKPEPEEDTEVSLEDLRAMTLMELIQLADKENIDINGLKDAEEIIAKIVEAAETDEPPF